MNESAWHRHPPRPISSLIVDDVGPNPEPYLESELLTAKPAPVWPRSATFTLTTIVIVLVAILVVLGIGELRVVKAEREEKARIEFCEDWEQTESIPLDMCR